MHKTILLALPLALYSSTSMAGLISEIYSSIENSPVTTSSDTGPVTASVSESVVFQGGLTTSEVKASTDYGYNKASVLIDSGVDNPGYIGANGSARSYWSDQLVVNSVVSNGYIKAGLDFSANINLDFGPDLGGGIGVGQSGFQYSLMGNGIVYSERYGLSSGGVDSPYFVDHAIFYSGGYEALATDLSSGDQFHKRVAIFIPFTSGAQFNLISELMCAAQATHSIASCNAGSSAYWAGVLDVQDASGNSIANWSIESASGTDYTKSFVPGSPEVPSVPEPASMALLLAGMLGLTVFRHARSSA